MSDCMCKNAEGSGDTNSMCGACQLAARPPARGQPWAGRLSSPSAQVSTSPAEQYVALSMHVLLPWQAGSDSAAVAAVGGGLVEGVQMAPVAPAVLLHTKSAARGRGGVVLGWVEGRGAGLAGWGMRSGRICRGIAPTRKQPPHQKACG